MPQPTGGEVLCMSAARIAERRVTRIPCSIDAPGDARRWAGWLGDAVEPQVREAIMIVVSELVTNAVRHSGLAAGQPIEVRGEVRDDRVTLTVRDRGVGMPASPPRALPPPDSAGSRGLFLVNRLATRVLMDPAGGAVTCEFAR
jgi:anti-sigma regulatory factor (Ser/Thr protein kinase)